MGIEKDRRRRVGPSAQLKLKVALVAVDTAGGVVSLANPFSCALIVTKIIIDVTTPATVTCHLSAGIAAGATTLSATLIDTVDVHAAAIVADNITNKGSGGAATRKWSSSQYLTISVQDGASAGMVGSAYIIYHIA